MRFKRLLAVLVLAAFLPLQAYGAATFGPVKRLGTAKQVAGTISLNTYATGGISILPSAFGYSTQILSLIVQPSGGYIFEYVPSTGKVMAYIGGGSTPSGTLSSVSAGTPAGTVSTPTFTGTSPTSSLNLASPAFSGTGLTAAGQVITTTDNQTMTLNQCAGMWLISATGATPPNLILSNTAVAGAPAVLTVQGAASTDAGAYKIVKALTPVGTISGPTFTGSALGTHTHTFTGSAGSAGTAIEVTNGVDLSAINATYIAVGR